MTKPDAQHAREAQRAAANRPLACIGKRCRSAGGARAIVVLGALAAGACAGTRAPEPPTRGVAPSSPERGARLRVVATSDFHGHLIAEAYAWSHGRTVGGAAALAGYFRRERANAARRGRPTILLDAGDLMQGTPISNLSWGRSSVAFYNTLGYAAVAIGNHEFDWSVDTLRARMAEARFAWLAANITVAGSDTAPSWVRPAAMLQVEGERVGVIGLAAEETPTTTKPSNVAGLRFGDGATVMDRWVSRLRSQGADFVVVVAHAGAGCPSYHDAAEDDGSVPGSLAVLESDCRGEIVDWARRVRNRPDLIIAGHTHRPIETRVNGIPIVEPASYGARYDVVDLVRIGSDSVETTIRSVTPWADAVAPDRTVTALVERYRTEIGPKVERVIASLDTPLEKAGPQYALGNLIADAQRASGGADVAIMNNGGIRTSLPRGPVTWRELYELQPFGNRIVVLRLDGDRLRRTLEHALSGSEPSVHISGLRVSYDVSRPPGRRIVDVRLDNGEPVRDDRTYTVAVNDFMAEGGSGFEMLKSPQPRTDTGVTDLDALIVYLESRPQPVHAPDDTRIRAVHGDGSKRPAGRSR